MPATPAHRWSPDTTVCAPTPPPLTWFNFVKPHLMVIRIIPASPMPTTDWPIREKGGCLVGVQGPSAHYLPISGVIPVSISNLPFDY